MGLSTAPIDILTLKYNWITVAIFLVVYLFAIYLFYRIYLESVTNNHFKITKIVAKRASVSGYGTGNGGHADLGSGAS